jgi:hypothetical protein
MNSIGYLSKSKATSNELSLEYWDIYISDGFMEALRGNFSKITEIYIPELELTINKIIDPINIFISSKDRYKSDRDSMSGKPPKLKKTVIITKSSDAAKTLIWLADIYKNKTEKEKSLISLFD